MTDPLAPGVFSADLVKIGKLISVIQAPDGVAVTVENLAAQINPTLALEIDGAQVTLLLLAALLEYLGIQRGVYAPPLGAPRATGII
jgi:hypothetical protein